MGGNSYPQSISSGRQDVRTWQVAEVGSTVALMITRSSKSASSGSVHLPPGGKRKPYYQSCHFQLSLTLYLCSGAEAMKGSCFVTFDRDIILQGSCIYKISSLNSPSSIHLAKFRDHSSILPSSRQKHFQSVLVFQNYQLPLPESNCCKLSLKPPQKMKKCVQKKVTVCISAVKQTTSCCYSYWL